jgi:hypothetical protein
VSLDDVGRYAIGAVIGALLASPIVWRLASEKGEATLQAWESAARRQQDVERGRDRKHNSEVLDGWIAAARVLRARLDSGAWRPRIPAAPGSVPAGGAPATAPGNHGAAGDAVPDPARLAAELSQCGAERKRLIADGAKCGLHVQACQAYAEGPR